jgi:hypothetical protein
VSKPRPSRGAPPVANFACKKAPPHRSIVKAGNTPGNYLHPGSCPHKRIGFLRRPSHVAFSCSGLAHLYFIRDGRNDTATDAAPRLALRTAAVRLRRQHRLGGEQPAWPTLALRDRYGRPYDVARKDTTEQLVYFPRHLLMDRSSRFFSCSVQPPRCCSTGRSRQISSLRVTRSSLSCWKR